jgi:hypothetical protein
VLEILNNFQRQEEEGGCHEIRDDHGRVDYSRNASKSHGHHLPPFSERNFYASNDPISNPKVSPIKHQRRKQEVDSLQGEMRKLKTPSFEGEREREDYVKAWFLGLRRYF